MLNLLQKNLCHFVLALLPLISLCRKLEKRYCGKSSGLKMCVNEDKVSTGGPHIKIHLLLYIFSSKMYLNCNFKIK